RAVVAPVARIAKAIGQFALATNGISYARFEAARANSDYSSGFIHQDSVFELHGLTAWIALSPCGKDAPALQFIRRKRRQLLPTAAPDAKQISPRRFFFWEWTKPIFEPGDVVLFDSYTVHGTNITRRMRG